jgi:hypothetical protein
MTNAATITEPASSANARERLPALLLSLRARVKIMAAAAATRLAEADRLAFHVRQESLRRTGQRTRNNLLFAHGSNAEKGGYLDLPDLAILGLEHHGPLYALWIAISAGEVTGSRGAYLDHIFSCPRRLAWCQSEGARVAWHWSKALRDEQSSEFEERDRQGTLGAWRKLHVSEKQHYLIALICQRRGIRAPVRLRRGTAYEWIRAQGGHPDYWQPPVRLPDWAD